MNDETDTDELEAAIEIDAEPIAPTSKKRFGPFALTGTAFLASLLGAGVMYGVSTLTTPDAPDLGPTQERLAALTASSETLKSEAKTLKAQIARLERDLKARPAQKPVDLSIVERRLAALEDVVPAQSQPQIDEDLLARLEALQSEGSETLDLSEILSRLASLEDETANEIDILARIVALETGQQRVDAPIASLIDNSAPASIAFPESKIRQAIDRAAPQQGWLKKSLKKHISVQSEDNPTYLLETILKNLEAGETEAAVRAFDKLPPQVKSEGQDWRDMMESSE